jgi:hypothetical protein
LKIFIILMYILNIFNIFCLFYTSHMMCLILINYFLKSDSILYPLDELLDRVVIHKLSIDDIISTEILFTNPYLIEIL